MATWYSVETSDEQTRLLAAWSGAPIENLEMAGMLLEVARLQTVAYAPEPADELASTAPLRLTYAQLLQAQRLWAAGSADENGDVGTESYSFVPRPLDKTIRAIIRPTSGAADVF